ncbi:hypothetical protein [Methylobacterium sp. 77]|uniref:hypothetical protein n=1 Tax=Methylobacterium sp. 77 TaxID=1101192 RepID=UPI0003A748AE|nr:hypothetical protein [Methylobacterium sp. 77]
MRATTDLATMDAEQFGRAALGPILAEFCQRLWLFERFLPEPGDAALLFCARGGLRLKLVYERFLARTGLPARLPAEALMVSRLVAARTAVAPPRDGVLAELGREFAGRPMGEAASALAQCDDLDLPPSWQAPFRASSFATLICAQEPGASALRQAVALQDSRFRAHLAACMAGRRHGILVDTGLYGSTVRMLREGVPEMRWSGLQFARSNYKRFAAPHFDCTLGVSVESDVYKPWEVRTSALRFWQLIEAVLEPDLPSVRVFAAAREGEPPKSNLQVADWQSRVAPREAGLFDAALSYIDDLTAADLRRLPDEAARGWRLFKRRVVWPDRQAVTSLALEDRSRDFGRLDQVAQFAAPAASSLQQIRNSLWREGAVMRGFPRMGYLGLMMIELAHLGRSLKHEALAMRRA